MASKSFPVVRGRMMRITKVDGCGRPVPGEGNSIVTDGFVSVALTSNITEAEEIVVTGASGRVCVRDPGKPSFDGYGVEVTFCEVNPCLFALITGQDSIVNGTGDLTGFKMNSKKFSSTGFALEVWTGVPGGDVCAPPTAGASGAADPAGYFVLPNIQGGVLGDFTIENAAITFGITGASTRDGNAWGTGPYSGPFDTTDPIVNPHDAGPYLDSALDANDHLAVQFTDKGVPSITDGCVDLKAAGARQLMAGGTNPAPPTVAAQGTLSATVTISRTAPTTVGNVTPPAAFPASGPVKVHWGDGKSDTIAGTVTTASHTYAAAGTYTVTVETSIDYEDFTAPVTVA